jgi:hypothetical protein
MPSKLTLVGVLLLSALAACVSPSAEGGSAPRYRAIAKEATASGRRCARELEGLSDERPEVAWGALQPQLGAASGSPTEGEQLARWDQDEVRRRVARLEQLERAVATLGARPAGWQHLDLAGLAEQSRGLARGLCRARDVVATVARSRPPMAAQAVEPGEARPPR